MTIFNTQHLVSVSVVDKSQHPYYNYKKKSFWNSIPHFASMFGGAYSEEDLIKKNYIIEDNKVYYKPKVVLTFSNGDIRNLVVNTSQEAKDLANEYLDKYIKPESRINL